MYWDHEGLEIPCTHISDGEEDENLLKQLEALDPCSEYHDHVFAERVENFLKEYVNNTRLNNDQSHVPVQSKAEPVRSEVDPVVPLETGRKSGMPRKNILRFTNVEEEQEPPQGITHNPRRSWYPLPMATNPPGAMSTAFPAAPNEEDQVLLPGKREIMPRRLIQ